jgi:hypothetical protein
MCPVDVREFVIITNVPHLEITFRISKNHAFEYEQRLEHACLLEEGLFDYGSGRILNKHIIGWRE